jgi:hypothetical protein
MYFFDSNTVIGLHSFDGTNDVVVSNVPPTVVGLTFTVPPAPVITYSGAVLPLLTPLAGNATPINPNNTGTSSYTYQIVLRYGTATSIHSAGTVLGAGFIDVLSPTRYVKYTGTIQSANFVGTSSTTAFVDLYRTATTQGGLNTGLIGTATLALQSSLAFTINDTGQAGDNSTPPNSATAGTTYTYVVEADGAGSNSGPSASGSYTHGYAPLSSTDYTIVTPVSPPVAGATFYNVWRTVGGATTGLIGNAIIAANIFTTGNGSGLGSGNVFTDGALTGDASTPPAAAGTTATNALGIFDVITDGTTLYAAIFDGPYPTSDPVVRGRILTFDPVGEVWSQIGAEFPTASGNGTSGALAFWGGALNYATFAGVTAGNTSYLASTAQPLPAGGVVGTVTQAVNLAVASMVMFNGALYVGYVSNNAGTAGIIDKLGPLGTHTTALTAPRTNVGNGFTSLSVFNGRIVAGFTAGDGVGNPLLYTSADGVTWTTETTLNAVNQVGQMVIFQGSLYIALNQTGAGWNTSAAVIKRSPSGTWSTVFSPGQALTGAIAVVYS